MLNLMLAAVASIVVMATEPSMAADPRVRTEVTIQPGDSLSAIAARFDCSIAELKRWNPSIKNDDLVRIGDVLVVMTQQPHAGATAASAGSTRAGGTASPQSAATTTWQGYYDVKRGDTPGGVARKLGITIAQLRHWNGLSANDPIRIGQVLKFTKTGVRPTPRSVGRPTRGRLVDGIHLGRGPGYRLRFPKNAHTTLPVARTLRLCTRKMSEKFRGTADILIGDISKPTGGRFPPHVSHQSGRDADVGYYLKGNVQNKTMHVVRPHDLDYTKNWALLRCMIENDEVVRVFMDTAIQRAMVAYLRKHDLVSDATLNRLFEVFGDKTTGALIRHAPKHDTHVHVRFACEGADRECAEDDGDTVFRF